MSNPARKRTATSSAKEIEATSWAGNESAALTAPPATEKTQPRSTGPVAQPPTEVRAVTPSRQKIADALATEFIDLAKATLRQRYEGVNHGKLSAKIYDRLFIAEPGDWFTDAVWRKYIDPLLEDDLIVKDLWLNDIGSKMIKRFWTPGDEGIGWEGIPQVELMDCWDYLFDHCACAAYYRKIKETYPERITPAGYSDEYVTAHLKAQAYRNIAERERNLKAWQERNEAREEALPEPLDEAEFRGIRDRMRQWGRKTASLSTSTTRED